jgi:hypothetical protein
MEEKSLGLENGGVPQLLRHINQEYNAFVHCT